MLVGDAAGRRARAHAAAVSHRELAIAAFEAGAHVLVEKPAATTWRGTASCATAARAHEQLLVRELQLPLLAPPCAPRWTLHADGELGDVLASTSASRGVMGADYADGDARPHFAHALPGGALQNFVIASRVARAAVHGRLHRACIPSAGGTIRSSPATTSSAPCSRARRRAPSSASAATPARSTSRSPCRAPAPAPRWTSTATTSRSCGLARRSRGSIRRGLNRDGSGGHHAGAHCHRPPGPVRGPGGSDRRVLRRSAHGRRRLR